jgi:large subunit ribosomal protein L28
VVGDSRLHLVACSGQRSFDDRAELRKGKNMSSVCDVCGKTPGFGNNISHSHRRTRRRWNPNIQKIRVVVNGSPRRMSVCTKCLKANKVTKAG